MVISLTHIFHPKTDSDVLGEFVFDVENFWGCFVDDVRLLAPATWKGLDLSMCDLDGVEMQNACVMGVLHSEGAETVTLLAPTDHP